MSQCQCSAGQLVDADRERDTEAQAEEVSEGNCRGVGTWGSRRRGNLDSWHSEHRYR